MPETVSVRTPSALHFVGSGEGMLCGANQEWFGGVWKRKAGCGPTVAASLLWYLARTRPGCAGLAPSEQSKEAMLTHMEEVWHYVKPGMMGVNRTEMFRDGVLRFGADRGIRLAADVLNVPADAAGRPEPDQMAVFLREALKRDLPPAFLNLEKGEEERLDSWHWVMMTAFAPETLTGWCFDQGEIREFDLAVWLRTTSKGGGFVTVYPVIDN